MACKKKNAKHVEKEEVAKDNVVTKKQEECTDSCEKKPLDDKETTLDDENTVINTEDVPTEADRLSAEVALWQDKYVRLAADFDNFRKRTLKEKMDLIEYSGEDVIKSMLSVLDDMDRAVIANEKSDNAESIKEGMVLIYNKMIDSLKQKGVTEMSALGEKLDTDIHDAIAKFPVDDESKKGSVIDVLEKGYKLKDKVIRFSKVVVGE